MCILCRLLFYGWFACFITQLIGEIVDSESDAHVLEASVKYVLNNFHFCLNISVDPFEDFCIVGAKCCTWSSIYNFLI